MGLSIVSERKSSPSSRKTEEDDELTARLKKLGEEDRDLSHFNWEKREHGGFFGASGASDDGKGSDNDNNVITGGTQKLDTFRETHFLNFAFSMLNFRLLNVKFNRAEMFKN